MIVLVEMDELRELVSYIKGRTDPDNIEISQKTLDITTQLLEMFVNPDAADLDDVIGLLDDEYVVEIADTIRDFIVNRLMLRGVIDMVRAIDKRGGLAIHLNDGEVTCSISQTF